MHDLTSQLYPNSVNLILHIQILSHILTAKAYNSETRQSAQVAEYLAQDEAGQIILQLVGNQQLKTGACYAVHGRVICPAGYMRFLTTRFQEIPDIQHSFSTNPRPNYSLIEYKTYYI